MAEHQDEESPHPTSIRSAALETMLFPAVGGEGRVEAVVRRLGEAISLGLIEAGERLPPETDLAARFDVAPVTLREALAILRHANLIETRRGRSGGTFVRALPRNGDLLGLAERYDTSPGEVRGLAEYAKAVEGAAAELAAERAAASELRHMRELLQRMERADDLADFLRSDARLHIEIAASSQNARLTQGVIALQSELQPLLGLLPGQRRIRRLLGEAHEQIVDAVEARDAPLAGRLARDHVDQVSDLILGLAALGG